MKQAHIQFPITALAALSLLGLAACSTPAAPEWWDVTQYASGVFPEQPNENIAPGTAFAGQRKLTGTLNGQPLNVTHYWGWYVQTPNSIKQRINIYVPETATDSSAVYFATENGGWSNNTYYQPRSADGQFKDGFTISSNELSNTSSNRAVSVGPALSRNMIVVTYGARSRNDADNLGHSPATMTDTKAAIRFVKANMQQGALPGNPERIVINGMSGGGGLTTTVAASGNSPDYFPSLVEIGAAGITRTNDGYTNAIGDDVFATMSSAPIIDLYWTDAGYEWFYGAMRSDVTKQSAKYLAAGAPAARAAKYPLWTLAASQVIAPEFSTYIQSLGFTDDQVKRNLLDLIETALEDALKGEAYPWAATTGANAGLDNKVDLSAVKTAAQATDALKQLLRAACSATNKANRQFKGLPLDWFTVSGDADGGFKVTISTDMYDQYVAYTYWTSQWLKDFPASDNEGVLVTAGHSESDLWGLPSHRYSHSTAVTWAADPVNGHVAAVADSREGSANTDHDALFDIDKSGAATLKANIRAAFDAFAASEEGLLGPSQGRMSTPSQYLAANGVDLDTAPHWYVRNGIHDDGVSFASLAMLNQLLSNNADVKDSNFKLVVGLAHTDNVNTAAAWDWLDGVLAQP
ncbi:MAG: hypothetical protein LBE59_09795 [Nevskiaceae bacterium]|jgi:hypothetical protein|nr:hypothetical protein [Nevskiaceae bacterium]